jgi:hypothetical protein
MFKIMLLIHAFHAHHNNFTIEKRNLVLDVILVVKLVLDIKKTNAKIVKLIEVKLMANLYQVIALVKKIMMRI